MLNDLLSFFRLLKQKPGFTLINLIGLTLSFLSFLIILVFVNYQRSFDLFHQGHQNIYRINFTYEDNSGNVTRLVNSPPALANGIRDKFPELDKISQLRYTMNIMLANGDKVFYEDHGYYADSLFLEILTKGWFWRANS